MRDRVPARGKPDAGDDGRHHSEPRFGEKSKPLEARRDGTSESDCGRQDRSEEGHEGKTASVTTRSSDVGNPLKGASNPKSVVRGNPGASGWRHLGVVDGGTSVPLGGASRRGRRNGEDGTKRLRQGRGRNRSLRAPESRTFREEGPGTEWTPPLSRVEGERNLERGARSRPPPPKGGRNHRAGRQLRGDEQLSARRRAGVWSLKCGREFMRGTLRSGAQAAKRARGRRRGSG